jgi:hypothetical protein
MEGDQLDKLFEKWIVATSQGGEEYPANHKKRDVK